MPKISDPSQPPVGDEHGQVLPLLEYKALAPLTPGAPAIIELTVPSGPIFFAVPAGDLASLGAYFHAAARVMAATPSPSQH